MLAESFSGSLDNIIQSGGFLWSVDQFMKSDFDDFVHEFLNDAAYRLSRILHADKVLRFN